MTRSVKDGGRLCQCGHMKCQHEEGEGFCIECDLSDDVPLEHQCQQYTDRVSEVAA